MMQSNFPEKRRLDCFASTSIGESAIAADARSEGAAALASSMTATDIHDGFARHTRSSPLTEPWEPIYARYADDAIILALRLARRHTNSRGMVHGGLIRALADNAMGLSCGHKLGGGARLATIGLAVDFIGTAQVGQWLAVEPDVIRTGGTICFAQCLVKADGGPVARTNATFRVVAQKT